MIHIKCEDKFCKITLVGLGRAGSRSIAYMRSRNLNIDFVELMDDIDDSHRSTLLEVFDSSVITFVFGNTGRIHEAMELAHTVNAYVVGIVPSKQGINADYSSILLAEPFDTQEKGCQTSNFDEIIYFTLKSIHDMMTVPGMINLEASDIIQVIGNKGFSHAVTGIGNSPCIAVEKATIGYREIEYATRFLVNVTGRLDCMMMERAHEAMLAIRNIAGDKVEVVLGASIDNDMEEDTFRVVIIGIGEGDVI